MLAADMAAASQSVQYNCPYLGDATRRTMTQMSQGAQGWFFRETDFNIPRLLTRQVASYMTQLNQAFQEQGMKLLLLNLPPRSIAAQEFLLKDQPYQQQFDPQKGWREYEAFIEQINGLGIEVLSPMKVSQQFDDKTGEYFFFKRDSHWTPYGAQMTAQLIGQHIAPWATGIPVTYQTEVTGYLARQGKIQKEIARLCTDTVEDERMPSYVTTKQAGMGEDALFGDGPMGTNLVLLGTSFSDVDVFHFAGFLAEYTGTTVYNWSQSAGGLMTSLISYLQEKHESKVAIDIVVWETLGHNDFNKELLNFRKAIAAAYGPCEEEAVSHFSFSAEEQTLTLEQAQKADYLVITHDKKKLRDITLELEYANGDGDIIRLHTSNNAPTPPRHTMLLRDEIDAPVTSVRIMEHDGFEGKAKLDFCRIKEKTHAQM